MSSFPLVPRGPFGPFFPILLSEVEQEQRLSGNGDRELIVVVAGLCGGEGERAYTIYDPHYDISGSWQIGHGNKFERICSNFNFEWTKFEFSKNRNKFESLCSNFEQTAVSIKQTSDISPIHVVPRGPLGPRGTT